MLQYAHPICLAALILVNLASLAPPLRRNRGGRKVLTPAGWAIYLAVNFAAIWTLAYASVAGPTEMRGNVFWLLLVFGIIAGMRVGQELGALIFIVIRSNDNLERVIMLRQEVERLGRAVENEEARRKENEEALKAEIENLRQAAGEVFRRLQPKPEKQAESPQPVPADEDEVDDAPDPSLLLKESGTKIPVELLKNRLDAAAADNGEETEQPKEADTSEGADPSLLLKDSSGNIPVELLKKDIEKAEPESNDSENKASNANDSQTSADEENAS